MFGGCALDVFQLLMMGAFGGSRPERFPADAHDAGVFGGCPLDVLQLMLMMPGRLGGRGLNVFQLMLMMLGCLGVVP